MKQLLKILLIVITISLGFFGLRQAVAQGTINPNISTNNNERYAWNDVIGWIDFGNGNVEVTDTNIKGYASSQVGSLALDCNTTPGGSSCGPPAGNWGVSNLGVTGSFANLAGWAWSEQIGWISFCGNSAGGSTWNGTAWVCPAFPTYQVQIIVTAGATQGNFTGWAWNDIIGWISFNCSNNSFCANIDYKVKTTWAPSGGGGGGPSNGDLTSNIFDTCQSGTNCGAAFNSIVWQGTLNGGTVRFQIASSDSSSGPWDFYGPNGIATDYYGPALPNIAIKITKEHNNKRYIRYKIYLDICQSGCSSVITPVVDDVIINWSP